MDAGSHAWATPTAMPATVTSVAPTCPTTKTRIVRIEPRSCSAVPTTSTNAAAMGTNIHADDTQNADANRTSTGCAIRLCRLVDATNVMTWVPRAREPAMVAVVTARASRD